MINKIQDSIMRILIHVFLVFTWVVVVLVVKEILSFEGMKLVGNLFFSIVPLGLAIFVTGIVFAYDKGIRGKKKC